MRELVSRRRRRSRRRSPRAPSSRSLLPFRRRPAFRRTRRRSGSARDLRPSCAASRPPPRSCRRGDPIPRRHRRTWRCRSQTRSRGRCSPPVTSPTLPVRSKMISPWRYFSVSPNAARAAAISLSSHRVSLRLVAPLRSSSNACAANAVSWAARCSGAAPSAMSVRCRASSGLPAGDVSGRARRQHVGAARELDELRPDGARRHGVQLGGRLVPTTRRTPPRPSARSTHPPFPPDESSGGGVDLAHQREQVRPGVHAADSLVVHAPNRVEQPRQIGVDVLGAPNRVTVPHHQQLRLERAYPVDRLDLAGALRSLSPRTVVRFGR